MSTAALTAAPPNALLLWSDGVSIFTELPGPDSRPVIIRYPLTNAGLSSALGLVRTRAYDGRDTEMSRPSESPNQPGTPAQREYARTLLKRMGAGLRR
jgi:hypothetical protein